MVPELYAHIDGARTTQYRTISPGRKYVAMMKTVGRNRHVSIIQLFTYPSSSAFLQRLGAPTLDGIVNDSTVDVGLLCERRAYGVEIPIISEHYCSVGRGLRASSGFILHQVLV